MSTRDLRGEVPNQRAEAALQAFRAKLRDDEVRAVEGWLAEHSRPT